MICKLGREDFPLKGALAIVKFVAALTVTIGMVDAGAAEPGQILHDTYCVACHDSDAYTRENRLASDHNGVRAQVNQWQSTISLGWSDEEIELVTRWLASNYYGLPCPQQC